MFNYKFLGNVNTSSWCEKTLSFSEDDWNQYQWRQKTFSNHRHTKTIPLIFNEDLSINKADTREHYNKFKEELGVLGNIFRSFHGEGFIVRALLVKMPKKTRITIHTDGGDSLIMCNRHHIAIETNPEVLFIVNDEKKNMKVGEIWEINNQLAHGAVNESDSDRVHLIIDWMKQ